MLVQFKKKKKERQRQYVFGLFTAKSFNHAPHLQGCILTYNLANWLN